VPVALSRSFRAGRSEPAWGRVFVRCLFVRGPSKPALLSHLVTISSSLFDIAFVAGSSPHVFACSTPNAVSAESNASSICIWSKNCWKVHPAARRGSAFTLCWALPCRRKWRVFFMEEGAEERRTRRRWLQRIVSKGYAGRNVSEK